MKNKEFSEILKKCFGKEKDERYHAIAMLAIYTIFILIVVLLIRLGGGSSNNLSNGDESYQPTPTPTVTPTSNPIDNNNENQNIDITVNDINYSYSYTITINGITEVYLGKKIDDKEKFTLVKNGITTDYAILSGNYLKLENGIYHITENPSEYFKYCDVEKILTLIENEISTENGNNVTYTISNSSLASLYNDKILNNNNQTNPIILNLVDNSLKSIDLELSNYLSSVKGDNQTLTIHMEFANIGTTEDFEIKVS